MAATELSREPILKETTERCMYVCIDNVINNFCIFKEYCRKAILNQTIRDIPKRKAKHLLDAIMSGENI